MTSETMDNYVGKKYRLKSSDSFEDYLKFVDIGLLSRKTATAVTPTAHLAKNEDGTYSWVMSTTFRTVSFSFKVGEEFVEERADGVKEKLFSFMARFTSFKVRSKIVFDGPKMLQEQIEANGRKSNHIRAFTPDTLTVTTTAEGWEGRCVRIYELVK